jgi:alkyl hydroperoxide reductase subunit F
MYDLIIVGGGPAGSAAAVYAARKRLKTALITSEFGGQSVVSEDIQNWVGTVSLSGAELAENLKKHVLAYADDIVDVKVGEKVSSLKKDGELFFITTNGGNEFKTKTVLIVTGSTRRKLIVPGAEQFENKGITYCASCDGPLFSGKDVAVIGGGNAAFETAAQLLAYVKSVTLLNRTEEFRADPVTVKKVLSHPNMKVVTNTELVEIKGDTFVKSLTYKNTQNNQSLEVPVEGVFVEIGLVPATGFAKNMIELNSYGSVVINPRTQSSSTIGIWAAGDCTDTLYHQNNIAAGDAVRALEDIYLHLHAK